MMNDERHKHTHTNAQKTTFDRCASSDEREMKGKIAVFALDGFLCVPILVLSTIIMITIIYSYLARDNRQNHHASVQH